MESQKHQDEHLQYGPKQELVIVTVTVTTQGTPAWSHVYIKISVGDCISCYKGKKPCPTMCNIVLKLMYQLV